MSNRTEGGLTLVAVPQWTPQHPPFALAALGGHLRHLGVPTRLVDLNLAFYEEILTPEYLLGYAQPLAASRRQFLAGKAAMLLTLGVRGPAADREAAHLLELDRWFEERPDPWESTARRLPGALATLRSREDFYRPERLLEALVTVDRALELAALPYFPARLALNDFRHPEVPWTLEGLEEATADPRRNLFLPFLRQQVKRVLEGRPRLVALSINAFSQVLAGLTLARLLRQALPPGTHLALGGNFFGRVADRLLERPRFFDLFCDTLMVGEGETSLSELYRRVESGEPLDGVPDALVRDGGVLRRTPREARLPLQEIGFVDLEGLPLDRYLSPEPVVCLQASRGCYWGRCSFCDAYWGVALDRKSPDRVVAEMRHLQERYGVRHFEFIDECLPPEDMRALAREIARAGLKVRWFANARLEPAMREVVEELPAAGATMLLWGFETGSPRILKLLVKGVHPEGRWDVLRASARAGLWNFGYVFFGFPGETRAEALETVDALCRSVDVLHSYGRSVFTLGKHSPLARNPEDFGVYDLVEEGEELSPNLSWRARSGMSREEVEEVVDLCTRRCREAHGSPLWMVLRNRENLHLYLARHGAPCVAAWSMEAAPGSPAFQK